MASRRPRKPREGLPERAVALVRISDDRDGHAVGVGRQEEDCRALATRLGWTLAEVVAENDTSAYRTETTRDADGLPVRVTKRPKFRALLRALMAGTYDGLIVYDIDRLARQPRDLEALIDLVAQEGIPVASVTGSIDPSTDAGIAMARVLIAMAAKSSADTGRRVARAHRQAAEQGRVPGGWRAYGYDDDRRTPRPDEAVIIQRIADAILEGRSLRSIAAELNAEGARPAHSERWSPTQVRSVVTKPLSAGLRTLHGEVTAEGDWPAILDRATWEAVRAVLADPTRKVTRSTTGSLLAGIAVCGLCGSTMAVGTNGSKERRYPVYKCQGCRRMSRSRPWLDEYVTDAVVALLGRPEVSDARSRRASGKPGRALAQLASMKERRRRVLVEFATNVDADDLEAMVAAIDARIAVLEGQAVGLTGAGVTLPRPAEFHGLPLERQRAVVRALLRVEVHPATKAGTSNDPASVRLTPAY